YPHYTISWGYLKIKVTYIIRGKGAAGAEQLVIDGGDNKEMLKTVKNVLLNCNKEFSGKEAVIYDYLCDQFEGGEA
ncbi:hypothetical protein ACFSUP_16360, partial [Gracilibacillus thailandensis]